MKSADLLNRSVGHGVPVPPTLTLIRSASMSIYNYRKIYQDHFGQIPIDNLGRSYEIHHIDGNRTNHSLVNLRMLCPNCHAQTETYRSKNRAKI